MQNHTIQQPTTPFFLCNPSQQVSYFLSSPQYTHPPQTPVITPKLPPEVPPHPKVPVPKRLFCSAINTSPSLAVYDAGVDVIEARSPALSRTQICVTTLTEEKRRWVTNQKLHPKPLPQNLTSPTYLPNTFYHPEPPGKHISFPQNSNP